ELEPVQIAAALLATAVGDEGPQSREEKFQASFDDPVPAIVTAAPAPNAVRAPPDRKAATQAIGSRSGSNTEFAPAESLVPSRMRVASRAVIWVGSRSSIPSPWSISPPSLITINSTGCGARRWEETRCGSPSILAPNGAGSIGAPGAPIGTSVLADPVPMACAAGIAAPASMGAPRSAPEGMRSGPGQLR